MNQNLMEVRGKLLCTVMSEEGALTKVFLLSFIWITNKSRLKNIHISHTYLYLFIKQNISHSSFTFIFVFQGGIVLVTRKRLS